MQSNAAVMQSAATPFLYSERSSGRHSLPPSAPRMAATDGTPSSSPSAAAAVAAPSLGARPPPLPPPRTAAAAAPSTHSRCRYCSLHSGQPPLVPSAHGRRHSLLHARPQLPLPPRTAAPATAPPTPASRSSLLPPHPPPQPLPPPQPSGHSSHRRFFRYRRWSFPLYVRPPPPEKNSMRQGRIPHLLRPYLRFAPRQKERILMQLLPHAVLMLSIVVFYPLSPFVVRTPSEYMAADLWSQQGTRA
jgi:hypothetical protein